MSQAAQELGVAIFAAALFALATSVAVRAGSMAAALIGLGAFLLFSFMAAWSLWRLL